MCTDILRSVGGLLALTGLQLEEDSEGRDAAEDLPAEEGFLAEEDLQVEDFLVEGGLLAEGLLVEGGLLAEEDLLVGGFLVEEGLLAEGEFVSPALVGAALAKQWRSVLILGMPGPPTLKWLKWLPTPRLWCLNEALWLD